MKPALLIASSQDADMRYSSQMHIPSEEFILVDDGIRRTVLLSPLEYGGVKREANKKAGIEVLLFTPHLERVRATLRRELERKSKDQKKRMSGSSVLALIAAEFLKERKIKNVRMSPLSRVGDVETLRTAGIGVEVSDETLYPKRVVKSDEELKKIKATRRATVDALRHCIGLIKRSGVVKKNLVLKGKRLTVEFLKSEARKILLSHNCEAREIIISHGVQASSPHHLGKGVLKEGEPIIMDFFPRSLRTGYWFDMTRTIVKGEPKRELKELWCAVREAQRAGLSKVRAGVKTGTVHRAVVKRFKELDYKTTEEEGFIHGTGHGVGLNIHEAPSIHEGGEEILRAGMVLTVEPGLYYKKIGGVRIEDTVLVTKDGYKDLTRFPKILKV